ncbi:MAG: pyrroline-5-carboxylate reductase [Armatimonadetes bacterium]|nr:pyrroline-5-carboxylate reductase [Armatimonadota bacterium]
MELANVLAGKRLAIIGAGAMGSALALGLIQSEKIKPEQIVASDVDESRLNRLRPLGVQTAVDNKLAVLQSDVVLLCVKPQVMDEVLADIEPVVDPKRHCIISIAAGIPISRIESALPEGTPVVRVMPNTPAQVLAGASAIALGKNATEQHRQIAHEIFSAVGLTVDVPEKLIDAVTALSGSGPAYVFVFAEALADAGVNLGLPRNIALKLAAQTLFGAAKMLLETGKHPAELKDMVTSPGGTTIAALSVLERNAFRGTIIEAVAAAHQRAKELTKV